MIGGTCPDTGRVAAVWPEQTSFEIVINVPIAPVGRAAQRLPTAISRRSRPDGDVFAIGEIPVSGADQFFVAVFGIKSPGERKLPVISHADNPLRFGLGLGQGRQKHARENRDDGDDNQELDQGKTSRGSGGNIEGRVAFWILHRSARSLVDLLLCLQDG